MLYFLGDDSMGGEDWAEKEGQGGFLVGPWSQGKSWLRGVALPIYELFAEGIDHILFEQSRILTKERSNCRRKKTRKIGGACPPLMYYGNHPREARVITAPPSRQSSAESIRLCAAFLTLTMGGTFRNWGRSGKPPSGLGHGTRSFCKKSSRLKQHNLYEALCLYSIPRGVSKVLRPCGIACKTGRSPEPPGGWLRDR
jgi:hypothetical protein